VREKEEEGEKMFYKKVGKGILKQERICVSENCKHLKSRRETGKEEIVSQLKKTGLKMLFILLLLFDLLTFSVCLFNL